MTTDKIHFTKEKETMLMTLSGRALQSQWKNPILGNGALMIPRTLSSLSRSLN